MKYRFKHRVEYAAARVVSALIQHLPYHAALVLAYGVAWIIFHVFRFRAHAARARIRAVFGAAMEQGEVDRIAWLAWRNFCFSVVEMIRIPMSSPEWVRTIVHVDDSVNKILAHLKTGKGAIIATAHMGSWEMAALTSLACGIKLFSIAAAQKNPLVDEFINRMRSGTGFETLLRSPSMLKGIVRQIREGKVLAILPDVRSRTPGLQIKFLGQTANIAGGMGLIARMTGVPIFPCVITRQGWMRHHYRVCDPIWPDPSLAKEEDWRRITQEVFDIIEHAIRAKPEQWFWFNKRWVLDPLVQENP